MLQPIFCKIVTGEHLSELEAECMMEEIMNGHATAAQIGGLLTALSIKGETVEEIAGCARVMRRKAISIIAPDRAVDTCGTGGDSKHTFNISTAAAFVVAGAGVAVAKHGNRSVSSKCGSADVLEALGVNIHLEPGDIEQSLKQLGIGFLFAPAFHKAMKNVASPRREIGIRTIFNILGPLANPAGTQNQVIGVFQPELTEMLAGVLLRLGARRALVVHGLDGLDEISVCAPTKITELCDSNLRTYYVCPEDFGMTTARSEVLAGGDALHNAQIILQILQGETGPRRDIVLLNAAAALVAGEAAENLATGVAMAASSIDNGRAMDKLSAMKNFVPREMHS